MTDVTAGVPVRRPDTPGWVCVDCRACNPMAVDSCWQCGRAFGEGLSDGDPQRLRGLQWLARGAVEFVLVNFLFVLWRIIGNVSLLHADGAFARGRDIWRFERDVHLPSELSVQRAILGHPAAVRILNGYYDYAHILGMIVFLAWLYHWHRPLYAWWRNVIVAFTALSLLIGLIPVAPPRLLTGLGFVDTATRDHQSVYGGLGKGITDQLSSVPSVHVGWALLIAVAVISISRHPARWLVIAYPAATIYAVVATANHFWFDGIVAAALLAVVLAVAVRMRAHRQALVGVAGAPDSTDDSSADPSEGGVDARRHSDAHDDVAPTPSGVSGVGALARPGSLDVPDSLDVPGSLDVAGSRKVPGSRPPLPRDENGRSWAGASGASRPAQALEVK